MDESAKPGLPRAGGGAGTYGAPRYHGRGKNRVHLALVTSAACSLIGIHRVARFLIETVRPGPGECEIALRHNDSNREWRL
jgi:hypothetical protein